MKGDNKPHVIIIGAGLSGLSTALEVERLGGKATLIERADRIGGRVKTDAIEGFLLDRGFQVLLTSYPEVQALDVLNSLEGNAFYSGAICHPDKGSYTLVSPFRHFLKFLQNVPKIPLSSYFDFLKLAKILSATPKIDSRSTKALLEEQGISSSMIRDFLKPFFGGVFLDIALEARAEMFVTYLRLFLSGVATLPKNGMEALPKAIYQRLQETTLLCGEEAQEIANDSVTLKSGKKIMGDAVVVAVDNPGMQKWIRMTTEIESQSVRCLYFSLPSGKLEKQPFLHLCSKGPITNLCIPNHIQPSYAPNGSDLISATVVDPQWQQREDLEQQVKQQICAWFPIGEKDLHPLKEYKIKHALPTQKRPPPLENSTIAPGLEKVFLAGELVDAPSINGALASGKRAATAAMQKLDR